MHQEAKCKSVQTLPFVRRCTGLRLDISKVLDTAIPRTMLAKSMVVVCGGGKLGLDVRRAASRINRDFSRGKRETGVSLHVEGMS